MDRAYRVRGQDAAVEVVRSLVARGVPHAILITGPVSSGKTTLALDIAAALLCVAPSGAERPCRECRGCRLIAGENHPDLHRLAPSGAGRVIGITATADTPPGGSVRELLAGLALLPVEGSRRVAIVEDAGRMTDAAQNAILKTLEEPPPGLTVLLCADDETRLLPTVRSRCARVRLGPVGSREIEAILVERGLADPPAGARLARLSGGRPGLAIALAGTPSAVAARGEIARTLLDALAAGRTARLALVKELVGLSGELAAALAGESGPATKKGRKRTAADEGEESAVPPATAGEAAPAESGEGSEAASSGVPAAGVADEPAKGKVAPSERRRAALTLIDVWRSVTRDLLVLGRGGRGYVSDPALLEELERVAGTVEEAGLVAFLRQAERTAALVEGNANPELALDVLVLAWPQLAVARAASGTSVAAASVGARR